MKKTADLTFLSTDALGAKPWCVFFNVTKNAMNKEIM